MGAGGGCCLPAAVGCADWSRDSSYQAPYKFSFQGFDEHLQSAVCLCCETSFGVAKLLLLGVRISQGFAQTLLVSVLLIQQQNRWVRAKTLLFQMSKSTGNFLTLAQAVDKFSADGKYVLTCISFPVLPKWLNCVFCSQRSSGFVGVLSGDKSTAYKLGLFKSWTWFRKLGCVWQHNTWFSQEPFLVRRPPGGRLFCSSAFTQELKAQDPRWPCTPSVYMAARVPSCTLLLSGLSSGCLVSFRRREGCVPALGNGHLWDIAL